MRMEKLLLLEDFYYIREVNATSTEKMSVKVELNADHPVYKGHFPDAPIAPGVCVIQMIKEVVMQHYQRNLLMTEAGNIKFMALMNPNHNPFFYIDYDLTFPDLESIDASAIVRWESVTYLKFKGKFQNMQ
jgi:3-hydroxyacyl-[acyl-carrier-protein] dehydratase